MKDKLKFMKMAYKLAQKAYDIGEVPIGAVIVRDGKSILIPDKNALLQFCK